VLRLTRTRRGRAYRARLGQLERSCRRMSVQLRSCLRMSTQLKRLTCRVDDCETCAIAYVKPAQKGRTR
jgi:hypothetical protein